MSFLTSSQETKKQITYIVLLCISFSCYFILNEVFFEKIIRAIYAGIRVEIASFFLTYVSIGIPLFLFIYLTMKDKKVFKALGIGDRFKQGILVALLFSLPMLIGFGVLNNFQLTFDLKKIVVGCVFAALFEELYYRGFFFGMLFKKTYLVFIPSLLIGALLFASLHLYQSQDTMTLLGIFGITFLRAGFFGWLYIEWNYNLWVPIGMHFFMNLSWNIYAVSDNALGGYRANIIRALTIAFAIVGTVYYKKKNKIPFLIHKKH